MPLYASSIFFARSTTLRNSSFSLAGHSLRIESLFFSSNRLYSGAIFISWRTSSIRARGGCRIVRKSLASIRIITHITAFFCCVVHGNTATANHAILAKGVMDKAAKKLWLAGDRASNRRWIVKEYIPAKDNCRAWSGSQLERILCKAHSNHTWHADDNTQITLLVDNVSVLPTASL